MSGRYSKRLFFALWPDRCCRKRLAEVTEALRQDGIGRPVPVANYHITLVFLGDVPVDVLPQVVAAAGRVRFPRFSLILDRYGHFPQAQVAWLGCSEVPGTLARLERELRQGLVEVGCGETEGARVYCPHLTVVHKITARSGCSSPPATRWKVDEFVLLESRPGPQTVVYRVVGRFPASMVGD